jgi:hypothetical protein
MGDTKLEKGLFPKKVFEANLPLLRDSRKIPIFWK